MMVLPYDANSSRVNFSERTGHGSGPHLAYGFQASRKSANSYPSSAVIVGYHGPLLNKRFRRLNEKMAQRA